MFSCDCCGECCRHINGIVELEELCLPDGSCKYLLPNNKCSIYDDRPLICQIDGYYKAVMYRFMSLEDFYDINNKACIELKERRFLRRSD